MVFTLSILIFCDIMLLSFKKVVNMEMGVSGGSEFKLCKDTNTRPNRELMTINRDCRQVKPYVKHPPGAKTAYNCALNRSTSRPCKCATSF